MKPLKACNVITAARFLPTIFEISLHTVGLLSTTHALTPLLKMVRPNVLFELQMTSFALSSYKPNYHHHFGLRP
jgi:hypothetical protein